MDPLVIVLRFVHVVFGALWVGMVVFTTFFLMPAIQEVGPDGGKVMAAVQRRGLMTVMPVLAIGALISGIWLYIRAAAGCRGVRPVAGGHGVRPRRTRRDRGVAAGHGGAAPLDDEGDGAGPVAWALDRAPRSGSGSWGRHSGCAPRAAAAEPGDGVSAALRGGRDGRRPIPLADSPLARPRAVAALLAAVLLAACSSATGSRGPPVAAAAESLYLDLRDVRDRIDVAGSAGRTTRDDGTPVAALARRHADPASAGRPPGRRGFRRAGRRRRPGLRHHAPRARRAISRRSPIPPALRRPQRRPTAATTPPRSRRRGTDSTRCGAGSTPATPGPSTTSRWAATPWTGSRCSARWAAPRIRPSGGGSSWRSSRCGAA